VEAIENRKNQLSPHIYLRAISSKQKIGSSVKNNDLAPNSVSARWKYDKYSPVSDPTPPRNPANNAKAMMVTKVALFRHPELNLLNLANTKKINA